MKGIDLHQVLEIEVQYGAWEGEIIEKFTVLS
jgi:phage anti-repressor protein